MNMTTTAFEKLVPNAQLLTPQERQQVLDLLNGHANGELMTEDELEKLLVDVGLLASVPARRESSVRAWKPLVIQGEPLSETIIRERR
jgi:hypothetical protein